MKHFFTTLRNLFQKSKVEQELEEELRTHLSLQIEQNLQKGMSPEEARRQAHLMLGGVEQVKESCREVRAGAFWDSLTQDLRYAIRSLLRSPMLVTIVLVTLALGIGANTAIFTVTRAVLLRPLPYPDSDHLVAIWHREKDASLSNTNFATFLDWKERLHSFQSMAVMSAWDPVLFDYGDPAPLEGMSVSREFFSMLGIGPYIGRDFLPDEDQPNRNRVVILTYNFWRNRLGSDPSIVGRQINLSGIPRTVVGILPPQFESILRYSLKEAEIFRPLGYDTTLPYACRSCNHLTAMGRIRSDVSVSRAAQEIDSFTAQLIKKYPQDYGIAGATIVPFQEQLVSKVRNILILLLASVGIVLLIACANIANLMLARATRRSREMAIRGALGASRSRLLRQLLTESMLLAAAGGGIGIAVSLWGTRILINNAPATIPRLHSVSMDAQVLVFAILATLLSCVIFGLVPALHASMLRPQTGLQESGRSFQSDKQGLRKGLVIANIALAIILLSGASLLFQSIRHLLSQKLGFQKENVITMNVNLTGAQYDDHIRVDSFYQQILQRIQALPGMESAGIVNQLILTTNLDMYGIEVLDKPLPTHGEEPSAERFGITPGYFKALRIPVLLGRSIADTDRADTQPVVVVNQAFAEKFWPGEDPIGKQIHIGERERPWRTVVGVAGNVRHRGLQEPFALQFYMPASQWFDTSMTVVARTTTNPTDAADSIRQAIWSVDPKQPISNVATMEEVIAETIAQKRFALRLVEFFALIALFLAAIGVYGVMAYLVTARVQEIGLRMALGANAGKVLSMILRNGLTLTLCGICIGIAASILFMRLVKNLLFRVQPEDPAILTLVGGALLAVAFVACVIPAIRAARLDPVLALRHE